MMENPGTYVDTAPQGRESLGEGSADLEKLLQTAEAENLQMVKLIDTERQKSTEFQKQIEETTAKTEQLEESTKNLDIEAKQLHNKFKQNREICEGLKKTSTVLDEHEEALRKKLEMVSLERQTQLLQQQQDVERYEKIWASYLQKYEQIPLAKELSKIKETAMKTEASVREVSEQITKIQSQIIELEVEKTHMQEYLQGKPETAKDSIIKMAGLFVDAKCTVTKARGKVQELRNMKNKLESETQRQMELTVHDNESSPAIQSNEDLEVMAEPTRENQPRQSNEIIITSRPNLNEYQTLNLRQEMVTSLGVPSQLSRQSTTNQASHLQGNVQEQQNAREQAPIVDQRSTVRQEVAPNTLSSSQHNKEQGGPSDSSMEQVEATAVTSHTPTTPTTSGHVTPVNQSEIGTPLNLSASRSPLDFNKHMQYIRQATESPGAGFTYTGRSMYGNNNSQEKNTVNQDQSQNNEQNETDGMSYEAPLNDQHQQHDISLNFFQPFEQQQQQENQDQNLFGQKNSEPSSAQTRSIFNMQQSPSNSATSSPGKGFSFGSASPNVRGGTNFFSSNSPQDASNPQASFSFGTSQSDTDNNFLSSRSPSGNIFGQNNNEDNESFGGGFSLFGSSTSPHQGQEDNSSGFSFSFGAGGKSPSNSNNSSSGFFLF